LFSKILREKLREEGWSESNAKKLERVQCKKLLNVHKIINKHNQLLQSSNNNNFFLFYLEKITSGSGSTIVESNFTT